MSETGTVTNVLAALNYNEELAQEVDRRIEVVASHEARRVTSVVAENMALHYLQQHGETVIREAVEKAIHDVIHREVDRRLQEFSNTDQYVYQHASAIRNVATQAVQEHNRSILRAITGSHNF